MLVYFDCWFKLCQCFQNAGMNRKIHYSLVNSAEGQFSIDEFSGIIRLEKPLDRELQAVYTLILKATDEGLPRRLSSTSSLIVSVLDINDNPPVFEHREYSASVSEDTLVGTEVLQIYAASRDIEANAEITYSIASGNEHGKFSIESTTGNRLQLVFLQCLSWKDMLASPRIALILCSAIIHPNI